MKNYGKVFSARLEPKEANWLDNRIRGTRLNTSIVIRDLIREKIALDTALQQRTPQAESTVKPTYQGKTLQDWEKELTKGGAATIDK